MEISVWDQLIGDKGWGRGGEEERKKEEAGTKEKYKKEREK